MDCSDDDLARGLRRGDREAFGVFFERYSGPLLGYLAGMVRDAALAEDLVQETMLRVYRHIDRYRERGVFKAWVFRIASNLALTHLRRRRVLRSGPFDRHSLEIPDPMVREPHERLESEELARWIDAGIETLPGDQRAVFLLRVRHEMPVREIAHILCVPEGTVKSRFHHAVRRLREFIDEKDGHSGKENDHDHLFGSTPAPDRARVRRSR